MSTVRLARHRIYTQWKLQTVLMDSDFPAESALLARLKQTQAQLFTPFPFPYSGSSIYHYHLAFLVQSVELLPLNMDLAFDSMWRATESLWRDHVPFCVNKKIHELAPAVANSFASLPPYANFLSGALAAIPAQSCEFIINRLFSVWPPVSGSDSKRILDRIGWANSFPSTTALVHAIAGKYNAAVPLGLSDKRKAAMLLRLALRGQPVSVGGQSFSLTEAERLSFLINALLYTFRNDRFHGNMQPPFKSSKATLQTYAHVHFCFLWAHTLFLHSFVEAGMLPGGHDAASLNALTNLESLVCFYDKHLKR